MECLRNDFGPEINLGKAEKVKEHRIKWTTYDNLKTWGNAAKDIINDLGFGRQSTPQDNVPGEIYFYEGQMERIINFDETRITLVFPLAYLNCWMDPSGRNDPTSLSIDY
jgi:hypothetical protein